MRRYLTKKTDENRTDHITSTKKSRDNGLVMAR